jgi:hypothetical protein
MAGEAGLPQRTVLNIAERLPDMVENPRNVSMFELVNLITNTANDPSIRNRIAVRRMLEQAGGQQVTSHIARCNHFQSRLN